MRPPTVTQVDTPQSRCRFALAWVDITPPVGIYHRLWGAARHDRATGVHRPLIGDVLAVAPIDGSAAPVIRANLDFCGLVQEQQDRLARAMSEATGVPLDQILIAHSHTLSSGWFAPDRFALPGGDLILPFLREVESRLARTARDAVESLRGAVISYAVGRCDLAANRDYWDDRFGGYACGFNPDAPADDTVIVARVTDESGKAIASVVNYACHPTTLAWDNSLISPDFVGAMREVVEAAGGAPCIYAQGACGDLGPRHGFVGDTAIADRNGRQLGYAALSALEAIPPAGTRFVYAGPVVSGTMIGTWKHVPLDADTLRRQEIWQVRQKTIE